MSAHPALRIARLPLLIAALLAAGGGPMAVAADKGGNDVVAARTADPAQDTLAGYRLGAGDRVRLTVFGEQDLTGVFNIDGSGNLGMPLIGKVEAGGSTADELAARIADRLSPSYLKNPRVTVEVVQYRPFYIVGEVKLPGGYPYVSGMTVINAVALSGGFTYRADEDDFEIQRRIEKNVRKIEAQPGTEVLPGDVVIVTERFF